jgi:hypothetical protein
MTSRTQAVHPTKSPERVQPGTLARPRMRSGQFLFPMTRASTIKAYCLSPAQKQLHRLVIPTIT